MLCNMIPVSMPLLLKFPNKKERQERKKWESRVNTCRYSQYKCDGIRSGSKRELYTHFTSSLLFPPQNCAKRAETGRKSYVSREGSRSGKKRKSSKWKNIYFFDTVFICDSMSFCLRRGLHKRREWRGSLCRVETEKWMMQGRWSRGWFDRTLDIFAMFLKLHT